MLNGKKAAIVVVGHPRDFNKTLPTFVKNVLHANKNYLIDVYFVTYEKYFNQKILQYLKPKKYRLLGDECIDYPHYRSIDTLELARTYWAKSPPAQEKKLINPYLRKFGLYNILKNDRTMVMKSLIPQFVHMYVAAKLIKQQKEYYDIIMKTRFDVLYEKEMYFDMIDVTKDSFLLPEKFTYAYAEQNEGIEKRSTKRTPIGSINDCVVYSSHNNMINYFRTMLQWLKEEKAVINSISCDDYIKMNTEGYIGYYITQVLKKTIDYVNIECGTWRGLSNG